MRAASEVRWLLGFAAGAGAALLAALAAGPGFDPAVLALLHAPAAAQGPALWLRMAAYSLTALGSLAVLVLVVLVAAGFVWLRGQHRLALLLLAATIAGEAVTEGAKALFGRARPPSADDLLVFGTSFPSGHATMAAVVYLTLGALLVRAEANRPVRRFVLAVAVALTVLVGVTRVVLGFHWPTDVLAGWSIGGLWATLAAVAARRLQRMGSAEPPR